MKKTQVGINQSKKVVRLQLDAGFFFERAVRSLDRHRYDKAVKYFRLAIEKDPDNPVNHCNLAGILSELGRFEESNEILEKVLDEVDPELYECLFYMANNSANMGDLELAEDYLLEYLSLDPEGEYAEEAEDMLYMLAYELGRPPREPASLALPPYLQAHEEARRHLEEGRFLLAIDLLEKIVQDQPHFLAARNNLALAYYYTGKMDMAMKCIAQVLEADPANLHALCNLAVLAHHMGEQEKSGQIIQMLKKLVPFHQEHTYKLATTLGILGEHEVAFQLFHRLLKLESQPEASLYHYTAAAAWNTGRYERSRLYWKKAQSLDPDSEVASFYLKHLDQWLHMNPVPLVHYHYQLPFEEQLIRVNPQKPNQFILHQLGTNPLLRSSFFWALHHGDRQTKLQVLNLLGWIADEEVKFLLEDFINRNEEEEELKQVARLLLKRLEGEEPSTGSGDASGGEPIPYYIHGKWKQVLRCCLKHLTQQEHQLEGAVQRLWMKWVQQPPDELPDVRKVEAWAAALEYLAAKEEGLKLTQREIAEKYHVSPSTVSHHAKMLSSYCK